MKVLFFGTPAFAAEFLKGLINDPAFEVVGVITQPDEPVGRKKILTPPPVKVLALEHGIPVFQPEKIKDAHFLKQLKDTSAEVGVVVAFGRLLPDSLLSLLPLGFVNVHPSLLPKWRGPSPIITALAEGDTETGVSIMKLVKDMDAGPILDQTRFPITADETADTLTKKVVEAGVPSLLSSLKGYADGSITPKEQDHTQATFCRLLTRQDGVINWHEPAEVIERKMRAYTPWPGTSTTDLKIFSAAISDRKLEPGKVHIDDTRIFVGTSTNALELLEVQPAGGKRMKVADFLRGHRETWNSKTLT